MNSTEMKTGMYRITIEHQPDPRDTTNKDHDYAKPITKVFGFIAPDAKTALRMALDQLKENAE